MREKLSHTGRGLIACLIVLCPSTSEPQMGAPAFFFSQSNAKRVPRTSQGWVPGAAGEGKPQRIRERAVLSACY